MIDVIFYIFGALTVLVLDHFVWSKKRNHQHEWRAIHDGSEATDNELVDCFCFRCDELDLREFHHEIAARRRDSIWAGNTDPGEHGALSLIRRERLEQPTAVEPVAGASQNR